MEGSRFLGSLVALATLVLSLSTPVTESAHAASVGRGPTVPYVENFTGTIGVYAVTVDPQALTFAPLEAVEYQADASHPLASSFKPAVLYEALADIDAGSLAWRDRIAISSADHSLDGGRFPRRGSVRSLAKKMIKKSHNTSTDVLFKQVGIGAPTATLASWGLSGMRIVMPTREFWVSLSGLVPSEFPYGSLPSAAADFDALTRSEQIAVVEALRSGGASLSADAIDAATGDFYDMDTYNRATTFAILDDVDNLASARQMAEFYWRLFFANGLGADADEQLRKIMKKGDGRIDRREIEVPIRYWGGKGGSDLGMGSVAGYGETRAGNHVIYAILGSHMTNENRDWTIIEDLITWVFDTLDAP